MDEQTQLAAPSGASIPVSDPEPNKGKGMSRESWAWMCGIAGWLVPGLGHALQFMWGRALVVFLAVGLLAGAGASMKGNVFTRDGSDAFDTLGYAADLGTGTFYVMA